MFFKKWLTLVMTCLFSVGVFAQSSAQLLSEHLTSLKTFQADFLQLVKDKNGNVLQQSQGKMALKRPGLFRWETISPNQQLIIADGKNIWIDDKDLAQVTKQKQHSAHHTPGLLLSEPVNQIMSQFTLLQEDNNVFKLTPKGSREIFQSVTLIFQGQNLKSMMIQDSLGQLTTIQFSHSKINQDLPKNVFEFTPPKNADVIKN